jgi:hypothetical protein
LVSDTVQAGAKAGASKAAGFAVKAAYERVVSHYASRALPEDDLLAVAVAKLRVNILLGFVEECRATLRGHDSPEAKSERDWLDRKKRDLEIDLANAERGAIVMSTMKADDLRAVLNDDGQVNRRLIESAATDLDRQQSPNITGCFADRVRRHFVERFTNCFREETVTSEPLHRLITQLFLAELPAIRAIAEDQLTTTQAGVKQRDVLVDAVHTLGESLDRMANLSETATTVTSPINTLPPPPADFTGRDAEVGNLIAHAGDGVAYITGLRGLGGIGKTALALVVAHQLAPRFPDAALYINLRGASADPVAVRDAQVRIVSAFHSAVAIPDDHDQLTDLYRRTLADKVGLLLLDDARDASQVRPLLPPDRWALIVTSRQHFHLPGLHPVSLTELTAADARAFLRNTTPRLSDDQADEIARLCGRLPLALRLAGSLLQRRPGQSPDDYIRRLTDETRRIELLDAAVQLDPDQPGIEATVQISYDLLPSNLRALWTSLSVFPASFDASAAAAVWDPMEADA